MKLSRRDFLKGTAGLSAAVIIDPDFELRMRGGERPYSIVQGPTDETSTQLAIDLPKITRVKYVLHKNKVGVKPFQEAEAYATFEKSVHPDRIDHVRFENLELGETYILQVLSADHGYVMDERSFQTLDTKKKNGKVALLSCMSDLLGTNIHEMWEAVRLSAPDQILLLGDNVYGDIAGVLHGPNLLWRRYMDTRRALPFYHWQKLVPTIAIWDDHDFGKNNVLQYEHRENSLKTFNAFYAQEEVAGFYERGVGVSSSFEMFGQRFVMLDGRYYRTAGAILGQSQVNWMEDKIVSAGKPLFIAMGSQIFGGYKTNNFSLEKAGAPDFAVMVEALKKADQPSYFASGDVHFSEIMEISRQEFGFQGYEITSSCMHSTWARVLEDNKRRIEATTNVNFVLLELTGNGSGRTTCYGPDAIRFESEIIF